MPKTVVREETGAGMPNIHFIGAESILLNSASANSLAQAVRLST